MHLSEQKKRARSSWIFGILIFVATVGYAALRYNYFKGVPLQQFPLYVLNKAFSWTSLIFIGWSFLIGIFHSFKPSRFAALLSQRKTIGLFGVSLALIHVLMSFPILNSAYFPNFYRSDGEFTTLTQASLLFGVLSLGIFLLAAAVSFPGMKESLGSARWLKIQRWAYVAYVLALFHIVPIGYGNWRAPRSWPGGLPPITLLCSLWILLVLVLRVASMRRKAASSESSGVKGI